MGYSPWGHKELDMIEQLSTTEVTTIYDKGIFRYLVLILEKAMATHSSTLAWRIPMDRSLADYASWGHNESDTTEQLSTAHVYLWIFGQSLYPLSKFKAVNDLKNDFTQLPSFYS